MCLIIHNVILCASVFFSNMATFLEFLSVQMIFCGLDIGTTNTKAVLLNLDGRLLSSVSIPSETTETGVMWYKHFSECLDRFASEGHFAKELIICSVTGQGGSFVLLNDSFEPVGRVYSWTENAPDRIVNELTNALGRNWYYHTTGWDLNGWMASCRLKELVDDGRISRDVCFIASPPDFIYSQAAGKIVTDVTNAQIMGICDFQKSCYSSEVLSKVGIKQELLPSIVSTLKILFDKVPTKWGKISFVTGSHDQYAAMQAAGLKKDKSVMLATGTAWVINGRTRKPLFDENNFLIHPGRDLYQDCFGCISAMGQMVGGGFERLLNRFGVDKKQLAQMEAGFEKDAPPRSAVTVDIAAGAVDSESDAGMSIMRYMEWAGAYVAFMLDKLGFIKGLDRIVMTGGAASSRFWPQVIADLCDMKVEAVDFPEFTAYGAALHAQAAAGLKPGTCKPKDINSRIYEPLQTEKYQQWYLEHQKPIFKQILSKR